MFSIDGLSTPQHVVLNFTQAIIKAYVLSCLTEILEL